VWLKIPQSTRFVELDKLGNLFIMGGTYPNDPCKSGIYFGDPRDECALIYFRTNKEAWESLQNLFRAWEKCRNAVYLIPYKTDWLTQFQYDKREEERKEK
jgi:hypothetical protein